MAISALWVLSEPVLPLIWLSKISKCSAAETLRFSPGSLMPEIGFVSSRRLSYGTVEGIALDDLLRDYDKTLDTLPFSLTCTTLTNNEAANA